MRHKPTYEATPPPFWPDHGEHVPTAYQDRRRRKLQPSTVDVDKLALWLDGAGTEETAGYQSEGMVRFLELLETGATHGLGSLIHAAETLGLVAIAPAQASEPTPMGIDKLVRLADVPASDMAYYWQVLARDGNTEQCRVHLQRLYTEVCTLQRAIDAYATLTRLAHVKREGGQVRFRLTAGNWPQWVTHSLAWLAAQCAHRFTDTSLDVDSDGNAPALPYMLYDAQAEEERQRNRREWASLHKSSAERLPRKLYKERRDMERAYQASLAAPAVYSAVAGTSHGKPYTTRQRKVG